MYWAYRSFRVCVIWASIIPRFFHNWLESLGVIWSLDVHLSMYENLDWAHFNYWFLCSLLTYVCRFRMALMCVPVGIPLSQYGVVWAVCILGVLVGLSRRAPLFASWPVISLPIIHVCALTFCIMIMCVEALGGSNIDNQLASWINL